MSQAPDAIAVGDRIRLSVELLRDMYEHPRHRTLLVEVAHLIREHDGTVTVWLRAADRQDLP